MEKNEEDKLLIAKVLDKQKFCENKNKIQTTDFLDARQLNIAEKFLKNGKVTNFLLFGGYEEAERKMIVFYPKKLENMLPNINFNEYIKAIRIALPNEMKGEYSHRNYLGGIMKLGINRDKIGDILVDETGADVLCTPEICNFLVNNIPSLTRFTKSKIKQIELKNLRNVKIEKEIMTITIPSMRLDNIVSELAKCARGKANEILLQERVLVNYEIVQKSSKQIKKDDIITIRGKGRFIVKNILGETRSGRILLEIEKFV